MKKAFYEQSHQIPLIESLLYAFIAMCYSNCAINSVIYL